MGGSGLSSEIYIHNCNTLCCDQNRHEVGVVYYIRKDLSYDVKSFFLPEIENIFFEILLPNTKPKLSESFIDHLVNQVFSEIINTHFSKLDINNNEIYILGEFLKIHKFFKK